LLLFDFFISIETCVPEPVMPVPADSLISGLNRGLQFLGKKTVPLTAALHKI